MKFKFRFSFPARPEGSVIATTGCGLSSAEWKAQLSELAAQTADAAPDGFPHDLVNHPGSLDRTLVDDFMDKIL